MAVTGAPTLADRVREGEPRAVARAISLIEDEAQAAADLVAALHPYSGRAYLIGITGPPGAGKSTLVDRLAGELRRAGHRVGIVAVDPGVFIRSMATRGHLGGLARATSEAAIVLDAAGFEFVLIETVGVGQDEVDIVRTADASVVVLVPGAGDEVQALKAGIMEIADVFVVNKADREGADRTAAGIEAMLGLESVGADDWRPPIVKTTATSGAGVPALLEAISRFREHSAGRAAGRRRRRSAFRLREVLGAFFMARAEAAVPRTEWDAMLDEIDERRLDPYTAARRILERTLHADGAVPGGEAGR